MKVSGINLTDNIQGMLGNNNNKQTPISFIEVLNNAINKNKDLEKINYENNISLGSGNFDNLHKIMIDAEKADIALQYTLQIRNKIIDAYQEIMRMQI